MPIDPQSVRDAELLQPLLAQDLPGVAFRALAVAFYGEGQAFKRHFRGTMPGKFKTGGARVANAFKVYTAGDDVASLRLGIFTRWPAGEIYERGGTITPRRGGWLAVPVTPRAYTSAGRVKRSWRGANGKFRPELFEGLRPVKVRGGWLLVRDVEGTAGGRVSRAKRPRGQRQAVEPVFLLIRQTRRSPVLQFFATFDRQADERHQRLQDALARAMRRTLAQGRR